MAPVLYSLLALGSLVASVSCRPAALPQSGACTWSQPKELTTQQLQTLQPSVGLPPNTNVTLKHSALGIGHQNYTCNGTAYIQTDPGTGALALLYDTTEYLQSNPDQINKLAQNCNYESCKDFDYEQNFLGVHYFSSENEPTFNLSQTANGEVLSAVKIDSITPPDAKDVDWLFLTKNPANNITNGLSEVYRFDTFNGALTSCKKVGEQKSVPYTAQYWFYE